MLFEYDPEEDKHKKCCTCRFAKLSFHLYYCSLTQLLRAAEETCHDWQRHYPEDDEDSESFDFFSQ